MRLAAAMVLALAACTAPSLDGTQQGVAIPSEDGAIADDDDGGGDAGGDAPVDAPPGDGQDAQDAGGDAPPDACVDESTRLAELIAGVTEFSDATPQETIDAIRVELARLYERCPLVDACGHDALVAALQALIAIPIAEGTSTPRAIDVMSLGILATSVLDCATDDDDCPDTSTLSTLLEGVTEFGDATPQELLDALEAEVESLASTCPFDETCDTTELSALLQIISSMPIADGTSDARQSEILELQSEASAVIDCIDDGDGGDDGPIDEPFNGACQSFEWDRRAPYSSTGYPSLEGCTVLAMSGPSGWYLQGDFASVGVGSLSMWERSMDDQGYPLQPAGQLLDQIAGASGAGYFVSSGSFQFASSLPLAPYMPEIRAAGRAFIIYGRNNAASVYALNPLAYVDDAILLAYEYGPRRDSIRVLGCPASDLEGWSYLTFGVRQAIDQPFVPFVPDMPGVWAVVAVCPSGPTTTETAGY